MTYDKALDWDKLDYDTWRDMGAEGWGYEDVLPYFKKYERDSRGAGPYHGGDGFRPTLNAYQYGDARALWAADRNVATSAGSACPLGKRTPLASLRSYRENPIY